jgi:hypothetical protein
MSKIAAAIPRYMTRIALAVALLSCAPDALADPINIVPYVSLTATELITFNDAAGGPSPGTNYDGILTSAGASFAERFLGQILSFSNDYDVLSGAPVGPLALQVGAPGQNLEVVEVAPHLTDILLSLLTGLGPRGFPDFGATGEGSIAVLFALDQSEVGFSVVVGSPPFLPSSTTLNFFRRDGSLIQTIEAGRYPPSGPSGFQRDGGVKDIAGVSIHTSYPGGIGFDDIRYDVPVTVPEPSTLVLLGVGAMAGATRPWIRRKRHLPRVGVAR